MFAFSEHTSRRPPEETLALVVLNGPNILILAEAPCAHTVRSAISAGTRESASAHPAGLVLLASLSGPALARLLPSHAPDLYAILHQTRQNTMARRTHKDTVTLAVPVCPNGYPPEAALLFSAPTFRWDANRGAELVQTLRETAAQLSYRLGAFTYMPYGTDQAHHLGANVTMTDEELFTFLNGPWAARLACVRADGSPHVIPIWYEWHNAAFLTIAWPGSSWASVVTYNPAVALTVDELWPPLRRVMVHGRAQSLAPEDVPDGLNGLYQRLCVRYLGVPPPPPSLTVPAGRSFAPDEIIAQKGGIGERGKAERL